MNAGPDAVRPGGVDNPEAELRLARELVVTFHGPGGPFRYGGDGTAAKPVRLIQPKFQAARRGGSKSMAAAMRSWKMSTEFSQPGESGRG
jgi:hypothetical protein